MMPSQYRAPEMCDLRRGEVPSRLEVETSAAAACCSKWRPLLPLSAAAAAACCCGRVLLRPLAAAAANAGGLRFRPVAWQHVGVAVDVWALGVSLYELLFLRDLFGTPGEERLGVRGANRRPWLT